MSVVLDRVPAPGVPAERPLWKAQRAGRTATAFEGVYSDRWEVRVYVEADLTLRQTFRGARAARRHAADILSQFEQQGWTADQSPA